MVAVLITGMSGAGKSTALLALARLGFEVVDTDDPADHEGWIEVVDEEPLWRLAAIEGLLARPRDVHLFVAGTVANQGAVAHRFDAIVLLTAPLAVLLDRVVARTNPFGRSLQDRAAIAHDAAQIEPLLRAAATHIVDATDSPQRVVTSLVAVAEEVGARPVDNS